MKTTLTVVLLLVASNAFMTLAWYGHLKFKHAALVTAIGVSWLIAAAEYCFQVPANRIGYGHFTATQLKVVQEVISLAVFAVFAFVYLKEAPTWRTAGAFVLIVAAVALVRGDGPRESRDGGAEPEAVEARRAERR
ncbi:MAG: DMT family protein [Gemmata sp.]|jgi:uncharacterized protein (DUF486 family)